MIDIHIHKVSNLGSTSANIEVSFLIEGRVLEYFVVPIHIRVNVWIQVIRRTIDFIIWIQCISGTLISNGFIIHSHKRHSVHRFRALNGGIDVSLYTHTDNRFFKVGTRLGFNDKYTIRTACTVHGGSSYIFQYRKTFNDFRIKCIQIRFWDFNSVKYNKRSSTVHGSNTTDKEIRTVISRLTTTLIRDHTGKATGKSRRKISSRYFQICRTYRLDRTCYCFFLLSCSEGRYDYFIQLFCIVR